MENLVVALEIANDIKELLEYGLTREEIEGYLDFFSDNFFPKKGEPV